jgi:hypothetical protein
MPLQYNCLRAISGAYRATPIRNLEVEVGVPPLGIHLDSIQARFRVRLEKSEAAWVIREAVEKVVRWIGGAGGHAVGRRRRRAMRGTQGNLRGGTSRDGAGIEEESSQEAEEGRVIEEDSWERRATRGPPRKLQLQPIKANLPGSFSGFQMTIPAVC